MQHYKPKTFTIPKLQGISAKNIEEHLKLYAGYVKNANLILDKISEYMTDSDTNAYVLGELQRRFSFELNGIRNHELYFEQLEGGSQPLAADSPIQTSLERFKVVAMTRGVGWAILYWDPIMKQLTHGWVDEQHLGHLVGLVPLLMIDMWEHAFVADYQPSGKKQYIEDYFANINWNTVEHRFTTVAN